MEKIVRYYYEHDMVDAINMVTEIGNALKDFGIEIEQLDGDDGYEEFKIKEIKKDEG